jgi:hypothetical protein
LCSIRGRQVSTADRARTAIRLSSVPPVAAARAHRQRVDGGLEREEVRFGHDRVGEGGVRDAVEEGREHDHPAAMRRRHTADLGAGTLVQRQVEHHEIGLRGRNEGLAVAGGLRLADDLVVAVTHDPAQHHAQMRIVIAEQDPHSTQVARIC